MVGRGGAIAPHFIFFLTIFLRERERERRMKMMVLHNIQLLPPQPPYHHYPPLRPFSLPSSFKEPTLSCSSLAPSHHHHHGFHLSIHSSLPDDDELQAKIHAADWRAFRATLLQNTSSLPLSLSQPNHQQPWAHALAHPEPGSLLLAHPTAFTLSQHYFHRAVIFLFAHGKEGSAGVILNRPTEYTMGQLAGFEEFLPEFGSSPLYMGGDVGANALHVIHGVPGLEGAKEIVSGVHMGGLNSMKESIRNGRSSAQDYRWFVRYAGWAPGQLEREVAAGVWYLACSSKNFILKHSASSPMPLWREVLELMGDPYAEISRRAYGEL